MQAASAGSLHKVKSPSQKQVMTSALNRSPAISEPRTPLTPAAGQQTVRALSRRLSALSVFHSTSSLYGDFVWARGVLTAFLGGFRPGQLLGKADGLRLLRKEDHTNGAKESCESMLVRLTDVGQLPTELPALRFAVGSRVACTCNTHPDIFHPVGRTALPAFLYAKTVSAKPATGLQVGNEKLLKWNLGVVVKCWLHEEDLYAPY